MPYKEYNTEQVYFGIAEVAEMMHVTTSYLRQLEIKMPWIKPKLNRKSARSYTKNNIVACIKARFLISKGMTHYGINMAKRYGYIDGLAEFFVLNERERIKPVPSAPVKYPLMPEECFTKTN